jgi:small subunit ribosomal protein S2
MSKTAQFTIQEMLEAGVHYGHKKNRWNPVMSQFIYGAKGDVHIIDLTKTYVLLKKSLDVISNVASNNGKILFVGTKKQTSSTIAEHASRCKQFYINHRWLGGMLTNWATASSSIRKLKTIEAELVNEESEFNKKEKIKLSRKFDKLNCSLGGIRDMDGMPALIVVFDTIKESIAVLEAAKLGIPVVAIVDTNSSLENITYPIPGNDDSAKATAFFCKTFADTVIAAKGIVVEKEDKIKLTKQPAAKARTVEDKKTSEEKAKVKPIAEIKTASTLKVEEAKPEAKPAEKNTPVKKAAPKKEDVAKKPVVKKAPAKKAETAKKDK